MQKINLSSLDKTASFDVDCQNTFTALCPDELPVDGALDIVDELNLQAKLARFRLGSKDAHSPHAIWIANDTHPPFSKVEGEHVDLRWPSHAIIGTKGFELMSGLPKVTEYNFFVWKGIEPDMHPYGACYHDFNKQLSTGVIEFLHQNKVITVLVGGLVIEYCVKNTVLELLSAGFNVILNRGACKGLETKTTNEALILMKEKGAIIIDSAQELKV